MLGLPLGYGAKTVSKPEGAACRGGHPSGDAQAVCLSRAQQLGMYAGFYRDGELHREGSSRHEQTILPW